MTEPAYALVIGDMNYSSWSLRSWLLMRAFDIPFDEIHVLLKADGRRERILAHSPSAKVPALRRNDQIVWDTMAIAETLADDHPDLPLWPKALATRALARAVSAEMHSDFAALRTDMPMDFVRKIPDVAVTEDVARNVRRIVGIWRLCRSQSGSANGPYLFGGFSIADAMYAPVASRFRTYGVDLGGHGDDGVAAAYVEAVLGHPALEEWAAGARAQLAEREPASS